MMMEKFSIDSDFIESYLNSFIIKTFFNQKENLLILSDTSVFNSCVHLNSAALKLANCSDRRDKVENFITANADSFNKYKTAAIENCKTELVNAHGINQQFEGDLNKFSASELNFLGFMNRESEEKLKSCINQNI